MQHKSYLKIILPILVFLSVVLMLSGMIASKPVLAAFPVCTSGMPTRDTNGPLCCPAGQTISLDSSCQRSKVLNPSTSCYLTYCDDGTGSHANSNNPQIINTNVFGITIRLNSGKSISQIIFLVFSIFLAVVAIVIIVRGIYAAYLRAKADDPKEAQTAMQMIQNSIVGFIIIVLAIVVVQLTAGVLGIGSITDIVDFTPFFNQGVDSGK